MKTERRTHKIDCAVESEPWYIAKEVVKAHKVTMRELAERMNLSLASVHRLLNRMPNIVHVKMIADAIGVRMIDLFDLDLLEREYLARQQPPVRPSDDRPDETNSDAENAGTPPSKSPFLPTFLRLTGTVDAACVRCPSCHRKLALVELPEQDFD